MSSLDDFLARAYAAAQASGHIFPDWAACEAALESAWGTSRLDLADNNLFGMKQHQHPEYGTVNMPTREEVNDKWVVVDAAFIVYPDWVACFTDRMETLRRLAPYYPHYENALCASSGIIFVTEVSITWATDKERAAKVQAIYAAHAGVFA